MTLSGFPSPRSLLILAARTVVSGCLAVPAFRWEKVG
jgi:hypothetical protein